MDANENSERRWVWELLQNAKDVKYSEKGVAVEIAYYWNGENGFVEFKHDGLLFSVKNITFLVEQISTKERTSIEGERPKTTGKFGTGFLTTHLLSEKVEVEGIVKESDLPYKKFQLILDRSGRNIDDIIASVNASLNTLEAIDNEPPYEEYRSENFNTLFRYELDSKGFIVAEKGLEDLHLSLPFTLSFLPEIRSVYISSEDIKYEVPPPSVICGNLQIYKVIKTTSGSQSEINIVVLTREFTSIAVEIQYKGDKVFLKEFDLSMPKLFCDFPLVGSEDFPFPVIINSSNFNPTEPRDGVFLTDKDDHRIEENKEIVNTAVSLYYELLNYASENNWQNIYTLAKVSLPKERNWISSNWYEV